MISPFLSAGLWNLVLTSWFLYLFGFAVEGRLRSPKFLLLYLAGAFAATLLHHFALGSFHPNTVADGPSGAVMGVLGAALIMFPYAKVQYFYSCGRYNWSYGICDIPMWGTAGIYAAVAVICFALGHGAGVDASGHLADAAGLAAGLVICALYRPQRDSEGVSDAKDTVADTRDPSLLTRMQLEEVYRSNPGNSQILLEWMLKSAQDDVMTPKCTQAFVQALPRILAERPPAEVAACLSILSQRSADVPPSALVQIATKLEQTGDPTTALSMYNLALRDRRIEPEDEGCALFRSAMLYELRVGNTELARSWYEEIEKRLPGSTWADEAKTRLDAMTARP